ncbi:MAG TPA: fumarate reductase subunit FrdD [Xanthomonadales bacterium]|nr:fumarate reductase subunit FrdD [Xanthomonadales bacterium]
MAIAKKAFVWALFAAGGTVTAFVFPVLILLFVLVSAGMVPENMTREGVLMFAGYWFGKLVLFAVLVLSLWHAAHRMRVVCHDFGIRADAGVARILYLLATIATVITAYLLIRAS